MICPLSPLNNIMWVIIMLLIDEMESTRGLLYDIIDKSDRDSILKLSQKLDDLIVRYYREIYIKK